MAIEANIAINKTESFSPIVVFFAISFQTLKHRFSTIWYQSPHWA